MKNLRLLACLLSLLSAGPVLAQSTPADAAAPVVELMPILMKNPPELQLTEQQLQSLAAYRKEAAPARMKLQRDIVQQRGELRRALLENRPLAERQALMQSIVDAERTHFEGRNRCVEVVRATLSPEQFERLKGMYLANLPAMP